METGSTLVRVVPGAVGRWEVREPGSSNAVAEAESPTAAVALARKLLTSGGTVEVLDRAGHVLEAQVVPPPPSVSNPWWYLPPTRSSWTLGVLFLAQGVFRLVTDGLGLFGMAFTLFGVLYLSGLILSHQRDSRIPA